jgi:hypothetical protein
MICLGPLIIESSGWSPWQDYRRCRSTIGQCRADATGNRRAGNSICYFARMDLRVVSQASAVNRWSMVCLPLIATALLVSSSLIITRVELRLVYRKFIRVFVGTLTMNLSGLQGCLHEIDGCQSSGWIDCQFPKLRLSGGEPMCVGRGCYRGLELVKPT